MERADRRRTAPAERRPRKASGRRKRRGVGRLMDSEVALARFADPGLGMRTRRGKSLDIPRSEADIDGRDLHADALEGPEIRRHRRKYMSPGRAASISSLPETTSLSPPR